MAIAAVVITILLGIINLGMFVVLPRSDGKSKSYISADYVSDIESLDHYDLYQGVADSKPTTIVVGNYDKVINHAELREIDSAVYLSFDTGHNLSGDGIREQIVEKLSRILGTKAVRNSTTNLAVRS